MFLFIESQVKVIIQQRTTVFIPDCLHACKLGLAPGGNEYNLRFHAMNKQMEKLITELYTLDNLTQSIFLLLLHKTSFLSLDMMY